MLLKGGIIKTVLSLRFLSPMSCNIHVNQEKESHYGQLLILTQFLASTPVSACHKHDLAAAGATSHTTAISNKWREGEWRDRRPLKIEATVAATEDCAGTAGQGWIRIQRPQ